MEPVLNGDVRLGVALSLHKLYLNRISRREHSEALREELDHALTLVLSPGRAGDNPRYLLRNVRRDARRILRRRNASRPEHQPFESHDEMIAGAGTGFGNWRGGALPFPSPEELLLAREREEELRRIGEQLGEDGAACAEGLVEGESVDESASRTGMSPRRVRYLRTLIRAEMAATLRQEQAA